MRIPASSLCALAISMVALLGLGVAPMEAAAQPYTPPTQDQFNAAVAACAGGNCSSLNSLISGMIANDPNAAADIKSDTVSNAQSTQASGGDPVGATLAVIGAVESNINPAAGAGSAGSSSWAATLIDQTITGVEGALPGVNVARLQNNAPLNLVSNQYVPPPVILPPASNH